MSASGDSGPLPRPDSPTNSPRTASVSLQAAATMNAGLQQEISRRSSSSSLARNRSSPRTGRRLSTVLMNLQLNNPSVPSPGEMVIDQQQDHVPPSSHLLSYSPPTADPHHHRAPSLGELHQELEAEQEAQVNRLLHMIRQQQLELQRLQANNPNTQENSSVVSEKSTTNSHKGPRHSTSQMSLPPMQIPAATSAATATPFGSHSRSPGFARHRGSTELSRRSRTPSRGASPRLRATSISAESGDWALGSRDESAFYQAEAQMLTRENQMLRHRIKELEKQLAEASTGPSTATTPSVPSNLTRSSTTAEAEPGMGLDGVDGQ